MSVQRTFNKVIENGYYQCLMCSALQAACLDRAITRREYNAAKRSITEYLLELGGRSMTLEYSLRWCELPSSFEDRMKIYQNWGSRPRLKVSVMRKIINYIKVKLNV